MEPSGSGDMETGQAGDTGLRKGMVDMPQIWMEGVSKFYQQEKKLVAAVQGIDLTVERQEFVFVTGSSGAGKSTLLQLIAGELRPSRGEIYINNVSTSSLLARSWSRRRLQIGYVPQLSQLMRKRTIQENLETAARLTHRRRRAPVQARIQTALSLVGLKNVEGRYPAELSQGECRRVELARAIINSPPILVLDELTANLDEDTIWDMFHLISDLNRRGTTVIMATHAKQFVNLMRKRVITLVDGRIFGDVQKGRYGDVV